ncbi:hypothetical protein EJ04DRAFT_453061 [Polyplosphaeria fusca]|uniref:Uncharacterized protein n=1 Tax=Polyplosphaeria fusca TaxID=682080 RepID=A0A9P4QKL3_9PLEO|nr:hypothetical protein EJ04DRAFT_453061 [Polyplosphaeria fusca]
MALILLIGFILCFLAGLVLSVVLIYQDIMPHTTNGIIEHDYFWEKILAILFGISQTGLSIAGIIAIALPANTELLARHSHSMYPSASRRHKCKNPHSNPLLARVLHILNLPPWVIRLAYATTVLTAPNTAYRIKDENTCFVYESALLSRVVIASLISLAVSRRQLEKHKSLGPGLVNLPFIRLLMVFIVTNAIVASCHMCGAIVLYSLSFASEKTNTYLRQGIFLVRLELLTLHNLMWTGLYICTITEYFLTLLPKH